MKMFIFCTFLLFTEVCAGQISANGKDLKDLKDDYVMVYSYAVMSMTGVKSYNTYYVGAWGIDTTGFAQASQDMMNKPPSSSKSLEVILETSHRKYIETCQIKNEKGENLFFGHYLELYNALSKSGFSFLEKEAPVTMTWKNGIYANMTTYIFVRRF